MSKAPHVAYWDSSVFVSYFKQDEEPHRHKIVRDILNDAISGGEIIVTSSFTLVEVLKLKGEMPINEEEEEKLIQFFEFPFIRLVNVDREVSELARQFVWKHGFKPKDAVHVATAVIAGYSLKIADLFSWDDHFVSFNGGGHVNFGLSHPFQQQLLLNLEHQPELTTDEEDIPIEEIGPDSNEVVGLGSGFEGNAPDATAEISQEGREEES